MESLKSRSNRSLRAFCREWKRFKPHLHKSTSLPALQLIPLNKPRFTCRRCGFANTYVPLCLWCTWSSDEDTSKWEKEMPRHRRISAPSRASTSIPAVPPIPPTSRIASENTGCDPQTDIPPSLASDREKGPLPPPSYSIHQSMVRETYFATISEPASLSARKAKKYFSDENATQTSAVNLVQVPSSAQCLKEPIDQLHSMPPIMITFPPEKLLTRSVRHRTSKINLPGVVPPQTRTLRRKKRMSFVRKISSCTLRDRRFSLDPSSAQPASVRLGHPSRPYYTAIRKSMARPNSMPPPIMSSLPPSPTRTKQRPRLLTRSSASLSDVDSPAPVSPLRTGFSLSGETELRMVLSRSRTDKGEYRFRETSLPAGGRRIDVKRKVQILVKCLRGFVCCWTCE